MREKELRIKRPLIGVKVVQLPFLTSARDKALESQALWSGEGKVFLNCSFSSR